MDQAITATISGYSPRVVLVLLLAALASPPAAARPAESVVRPVGIVEQPCPVSTAPAGDSKPNEPKEWQERLLDPGAGREFEPADLNVANAAQIGISSSLSFAV